MKQHIIRLCVLLLAVLLCLSVVGCTAGGDTSSTPSHETQTSAIHSSTTADTTTDTTAVTTTNTTTGVNTTATTVTAAPTKALCAACGKATPVSGSAYCAGCKCAACNDRKVAEGDKFCAKHACVLPSCQEKATVDNGYCAQHGCAQAGCAKQKETDFAYCTSHNVIDILIFAGQSNMAGATESIPYPNDPVKGAVEFRYLTNMLQPLTHPVGEVLGGDLLTGVNKGSPVPYTCDAYIKASGRQAVAIHVAQGATKIAEWLKGTDRYTLAVDKIKAGIKLAKQHGKIGHIYCVWLQGESDAIDRTSKETYMQRLTQFKNDLKKDVGLEKFGIIEVGYFAYTVDWLTDRTKEDAKQCDETIMQAQEELPKVDSDFVMLTQICKTKLSLDNAYENPLADGHYTNKGVAIIGEEAGKALAKLAKE
ncbi:MAG: hypothetical protein IJ518_04120 [Clostridia bacterium]|nr:hypothetical protein [Clostridia bacterium]